MYTTFQLKWYKIANFKNIKMYAVDLGSHISHTPRVTNNLFELVSIFFWATFWTSFWTLSLAFYVSHYARGGSKTGSEYVF